MIFTHYNRPPDECLILKFWHVAFFRWIRCDEYQPHPNARILVPSSYRLGYSSLTKTKTANHQDPIVSQSEFMNQLNLSATNIGKKSLYRWHFVFLDNFFGHDFKTAEPLLHQYGWVGAISNLPDHYVQCQSVKEQHNKLNRSSCFISFYSTTKIINWLRMILLAITVTSEFVVIYTLN